MEEEKYTLIDTINGIEINEELMQKIQSVPKRNENAEVTINNYLIKQLGIDENQKSDDKKQLIQKNFIHLMCQVLNDLKIIDERLKKYKAERVKLEGIKSNEAEYRHRKLEYFAKLNKRAQNDVFMFLNKAIKEYLIETDYDTLQREINSDDWGNMFKNRRYLFAQVSEYYDADFDYSTVVKISQLPGVNLLEGPELEKKFLKMHRDSPEKYYSEIKKLIEQKKVLVNLKEFIDPPSVRFHGRMLPDKSNVDLRPKAYSTPAFNAPLAAESRLLLTAIF